MVEHRTQRPLTAFKRADSFSFTVEIPWKAFMALAKNRKFGIGRGGRLYTRTGYKDAIAVLSMLIKSKAKGTRFDYPRIDISWAKEEDTANISFEIAEAKEPENKRSDVDGPINGIIDAFEKAGVIKNDKYVKKVSIEKA